MPVPVPLIGGRENYVISFWRRMGTDSESGDGVDDDR